MKTVIKRFTALILLTLCGCQKSNSGGTTSGNPLVSFAMAGSSAPATVAMNKPNFKFPLLAAIVNQAVALPPPMLRDASNATISLDEAWISVKKVEFKASETPTAGEVSGDSVSFENPMAVNLIANNLQSFGQVRIGSDSLRRIKMQLHVVDILPSGAPVGLQNKSFFWRGRVGVRNFTFTSTEGYEYQLSGPNGVILGENSNILLSIQIANFFRKINMTAVVDGTEINQSTRVPATNPCPLINASATDLYTCFKDGLKTESNLGNDGSNDGELSGDPVVK
ncbi:MAG: hypothetical protein H7061_08825 [Bdellovibrionaceae bacterium]|nr:hypothetical protein [Bdellovibrio sp.]